MAEFMKTKTRSKPLTTSFWLLLLQISTTGYVYCFYPVTSVFLHSLTDEPHSPTNTSTFMNKYDYIVVGAGTEGAIVASRLSEIPYVNVLLLEAGGVPPILTEVPILATAFWNTHLDWQYKTVPQKNAGLGLKNKQVPFPAGKMLGGTSSLNNMLFVRGNKKDFDSWASQGAKGWSYNDVLPYFKKLEDNQNAEYAASEYHNTTGPVSFDNPKYEPKLMKYLKTAIDELGYEFLDSNAGKQAGFNNFQGNIKDGQRCSTAKAYLVPAAERPNFDIVTNAMVKKVTIRKQKAIGVRFDYEGKTYWVRARREVIVSAGAIRTPQLLMLSGVGPKEELEKFNISVLADLPVGRNLIDQPAVTLFYDVPQLVPIYEKLTNPVHIIEYITDRSGPYTALAFLMQMAFLNGTSSNQPADDPYFQINLNEFITVKPVEKFLGLKSEVYDAYFAPYDFKPLMMCLAAQIKPRSRGTLTLSSTDIYDQPLIDPNYFDDPKDLDDLIDAMKVCQKFGKSKAMQSLGSKPFSTVMPGCEEVVDDKDSYFRCYVKQFFISSSNIVGTAKMGDPNDPTTVVDPKLRVKNITRLRVVDGSIMPQVTSGNTNVPIMMIAEKAADMIKETITTCDSKCETRNKNRKKISPNIDVGLAGDVDEIVFKDSMDIMQLAFDEFFNSGSLNENKDVYLKRLQNPLQTIDLKSKTSFLNMLKDMSSKVDAPSSAIQHFLTSIV